MTVIRLLVASIAIVVLLPLAGCGDPKPGRSGASGDVGVGGGPDRERGRLLLRQFGCGNCHVIPGVAAASGNVGPTLSGVARRVYLSGVLPNTRENMARFIRSPHAYDPQTVMPDLQVSESQARDMVHYLYGLQ